MRVCDYITNQLVKIGVRRVYGLMGGGASGLNDGFIRNPDIDYISFHNEQGAAHAAVGESRYTGNLSVVNPTTGCGGTNCITSLLGAYQDSIPVLFLSGNVRADQTTFIYNRDHPLYNIRKYGIQEHNIIPTVDSITKFSHFLDTPRFVKHILELAINTATRGRNGPVWIDIPSDVQVAEIPDNTPDIVIDTEYSLDHYIDENFSMDFLSYNEYKKPLILAGSGIRQAGVIDYFHEFVEKYDIPYVSTYGARDYDTYDNKYNIGTIGVKGSRAGNFALQQCDLLLILGCSMGVSHIGYDFKSFSPNSYKIIVDIDMNEIYKSVIQLDTCFHMDLKSFFLKMLGNSYVKLG
ncbi:MAG: thiamine pyrophosphate-binding protein [Candidatus Levybacteria bacterium]|nr:thiamine pyrophosphate-binding protein [Candidatus Levybacteria bacterium]